MPPSVGNGLEVEPLPFSVAGMPFDSKVSELLLRWREAKQRGETVSPEQLCDGAPELLEEFQRCLRVVEGMEHWLGMGTDDGKAQATPMTQSLRTLAAVQTG